MTRLSPSPVGPGRGLIAVLALLAALLVPVPLQAQTGGSYIGSYWNWEAHVYRLDGEETRCAVRALHPAILEAEIYWVFNTRHSQRLPDGFLAVDRRVADGASELAVVIDGGDRFALRVGSDGYGYSLDDDAARLLAAMRRGIEMDIVLRRRTTGERVIPVSLLGFTRGSNAARGACYPASSG